MDARHIEALADLACDLDCLANRFPGPDRTLLKQYSDLLHDVAQRLARAAGVTVYVDDDEEAA